nr:disease resistance-like protein csa1 [Quercus suber]
MFHSKIKRLWEGIKHYGKLKSIKLNDSLNLIATPNVTGVPNLKKLVFKDGCMSLEEFPARLKSHLFVTHFHLFFFNCFKLAGRSDVLGMLKAHEETCKQSTFCRFVVYDLVIPGSEILQWFSHQSAGNIVNAQVPSHSSNKCFGIAVCAVFSCRNVHLSNMALFLRCHILINKRENSEFHLGICPRFVQVKSRHLWMSYIPSQLFSEDGRAVLSQIDEDGFIQIEVRFQWDFSGLEVKKCGFHLYEEDIREIKMKRRRDKYEGAGASASAALYLHSLVVSHSSLSHSRSLASEVVSSSGRTTSVKVTSSVVSERCMELRKEEIPQGSMVKIIIWFSKVIPKHVFIGWERLMVHNKMSTKD